MNIIELIGIIVGSIATILGGVWFMLYKAQRKIRWHQEFHLQLTRIQCQRQ